VFALFEIFVPLLTLGVTFAETQRTDAGPAVSNLSSYEVFTQGYLSLPWDGMFLRPGARIGYERQNSDGSISPIRLFESTYKAGAEFAFVYNGIVVPAITVQGFVLSRTLKLSKPENVNSNASLMSRNEWLYSSALSLGVGIPIQDGRLMLEPFYRFVHIDDDARRRHSFGFDVSLALSTATSNPL
jgi:hypothetical protein